MTNVALGTVKNTMTKLIQKGFIVEMGKKGKKLLDKKKLFERWIAAYPDYLKPKLLLGRFRGDGEWWKDIPLDPTLAQWGGEVAAAKLTGCSRKLKIHQFRKVVITQAAGLNYVISK